MVQVDYFEIGSPDPEQSRAFYGGLFGWTFDGPPAAAYQSVNGTEGGLWDTSGMGSPSWAIFYVHVKDVPATIAEAQRLGATVALPFVDNGRIQFAHLLDPQGNRFAVWCPKSPS